MQILTVFNHLGREVDLSLRPLEALTDNDSVIFCRDAADPESLEDFSLPERPILFEVQGNDPHPISLRDAAACYLGGDCQKTTVKQDVHYMAAILVSKTEDARTVVRSFHQGDDAGFPVVTIRQLSDLRPFDLENGESPLEALYGRINHKLSNPLIDPEFACQIKSCAIQLTWPCRGQKMLDDCLTAALARKAIEIGRSPAELSAILDIQMKYGTEPARLIDIHISESGRPFTDVERAWRQTISPVLDAAAPVGWCWNPRPGTKPHDHCRVSSWTKVPGLYHAEISPANMTAHELIEAELLLQSIESQS